METVNRYKYYVWTNDDTSEENELFASTRDIAIEWFNNLFLGVHAENRFNVTRIELCEMDGERILAYDTHMEVFDVS